MDRSNDSGVCESMLAPARYAGDSNGFVNRRSGFRSPPPAPDSNYLELLAKKLSAAVDSTPGPGKCWPWTKGCTSDGYGRLYSGNSVVLAHVAALEVKLGRRLAPGECSLHGCDNPPCCNPEHLRPGTKLDNSADAVARGRTLRGQRHPAARITDADAAFIRLQAQTGGWGIYAALAKRFGVSSRAISYIAQGKRRGACDPRRRQAVSS